MTTEEQNLNRVFWHELGHFIAKTINFQQYQISKVKEIRLVNVGWDFEGQTVQAIPKGADPKQTTINIPEKIAEIHYGCFFEAIHLKNEFDACFSGDHGRCDVNQYASTVRDYKQRQVINSFVDTYFEDIRHKEYFQLLVQLNYVDYLLKQDISTYTVDLGKLTTDIQPFIEVHKTDYFFFLEGIRKTLNWHKLPEPMTYD